MLRPLLVCVLALPLGGWTAFERTSRVDDSRSVGVEKRQSVETDSAGRAFAPSIQFECRAGTSYAFLHFDRVMACSGQTIAWRAGTKAPRRTWMANSTDCKGFGVAGSAAIALAREALDVFVLHVRATPHDAGPIELSFDVSRLRDAIGPVAAACRWPGKW